jgi:hypothetical protein
MPYQFTDQERLARIRHAIDKEIEEQPRGLYWCSFADAALPQGEQFLGVCIVEAHGPATAMAVAWAHGCNPGGEILCYILAESSRAKYEPYINRLLSRRELVEAGIAGEAK